MSDLWPALLLGVGIAVAVVVVCTMLSRWLRRRRDGP
jgi:hypothetical protein